MAIKEGIFPTTVSIPLIIPTTIDISITIITAIHTGPHSYDKSGKEYGNHTNNRRYRHIHIACQYNKNSPMAMIAINEA